MEMPQGFSDAPLRPGRGRPRMGGTVARCGVLAALWAVLTGGGADAWLVGAPAVLLAVAASFGVGLHFPRPRLIGAIRFVPFFLWRTLAGGADVARRVVDPRLPIAPGLVRIELGLPAGPACVLLADVMSLLPGSLSARLEGRSLLLHVIDTAAPVDVRVRETERAVADLLGVALERPAREIGDG